MDDPMLLAREQGDSKMSATMGKTVKIEIETAIRRQSWATAQVGQKSLQTILINFVSRTVNGSYTTGHTTILGKKIGSIRDKFQVKGTFESSGNVRLSINGQTASAVGFMPNIDYSFEILLTQSPKTVTVTGAHDGYPSYNVALNGKSTYDYIQGNLSQLLGTSDIQVEVLRKSVSW